MQHTVAIRKMDYYAEQCSDDSSRDVEFQNTKAVCAGMSLCFVATLIVVPVVVVSFHCCFFLLVY